MSDRSATHRDRFAPQNRPKECAICNMADKKTMIPEEKALLQAKHRQEEAEARNRKKERNARTHRLIQEGAILESVAPHVREMDLDLLKRELLIRLRGL